MVQIMQLPDFFGAAERGIAAGREGKEYKRTEANRQEIETLAPAIMGGDVDAYERGAVIDKERADGYQNEHVKRLKQLGAAGKYMQDAIASGDEVRIQAAWKSGARPLLARIVKDKAIPEAWSPDMLPALEEAMAMVQGVQSTDKANNVQSTKIGKDGFYYTVDRAGNWTKSDVQANPSIQILEQDGELPLGVVKSGGVVGSTVPIGNAAPPAAATPPAGPAVSGSNPNEAIVMEAANAMIAAGVPEAQVDAFVQEKLSQGVTVPAPAGNSPQTSQIVTGGPVRTPTTAEKKAAETAATGTMRTLSADEVAAQGLPPGTFAQVNALTGEVKVGGNNAQRQPGELTAAQKLKLKKDGAKAKGALASTTVDLDRMAAAVKDIKSQETGLKRTTGIYSLVPSVPAIPGVTKGEAKNVELDLDALKSQIGFAVLQNMRLMSPTGGSLGNVSNEEGLRLERNLAALETAQSYEEMQKSLDQILAYVETSKARLQSAYEDQFGEAENYEVDETQAAPAATGGWGIRKKN